MNSRDNQRFGLAALAAVTWFGVQPCFAQSDDPSPPAPPERRSSRHDPVAAAFAIPYGTLLSEEQRSEYQRLKDDKEGAFRQALDAQAAATTLDAKADAGREIAQLRYEIRAGLRQILRMPNQDASPSSPQTAIPGYDQQGYDQPGDGAYGQTAYYGGYYAPQQASYGYGYYAVNVYPWYGVWYPAYYWPRHHHHGHANPLLNQHVSYVAAQKVRATTVVTPVIAPARPNPAVKPVARPVAKLVAKPAVIPAAKPVAQPTARPIPAPPTPVKIANLAAKHR